MVYFQQMEFLVPFTFMRTAFYWGQSQSVIFMALTCWFSSISVGFNLGGMGNQCVACFKGF